MDSKDPKSHIFPGEESVDLYATLGLTSGVSIEDIKKAYRRYALMYHPDKHANSDEKAKADASARFQQVGFAYSVLSDPKKRQRYDNTGRTSEGFDLDEDGSWEAYFEDLFDEVTRGKLDEMKKEYQGSAEEADDLKQAYIQTGGIIGDIMTYIPHSTHKDEARFIIIISDIISRGELSSLPEWEASAKDEKARFVRQKKAAKEAKEAEALAKELGVWDEFYGSGKVGARQSKKKGKSNQEEEEDHSALQALILNKKRNMDGFFDSLAAKYTEPEATGRRKGGKGKKRAADELQEEEEGLESPTKKTKRLIPDPPDIDEEEFKSLQERLFSDKAKSPVPVRSQGKGKNKRAR